MIARLRAAPAPSPTKPASRTRAFLTQVLRSKPPSPSGVGANAREGAGPLWLGASGAVYACMTVCALAYPDAALALKMPPTFPVPIGFALGSLVALDVVGVWRAWRCVYAPPYVIWY